MQAASLNADDMHYMIPFMGCGLLGGSLDLLLSMVRHGLLLLLLILQPTNTELSPSEECKDTGSISQELR